MLCVRGLWCIVSGYVGNMRDLSEVSHELSDYSCEYTERVYLARLDDSVRIARFKNLRTMRVLCDIRASIPDQVVNLRVCHSSEHSIDLSYVGVSLLRLNLSGTRVEVLDPLSGLVGLISLDVSRTYVSQLDALRGLVNLQRLNVSRLFLDDLSVLSNLRMLRVLDVSHSCCTSLECISECVHLVKLVMNSTCVRDLDFTRGMCKLRMLHARQSEVTTLSGLVNCVNLEALDVSFTSVSDLRPLMSMCRLHYLNISCSDVTDVSVMRGHKSLRRLTMFNVNADAGLAGGSVVVHDPRIVVRQDG